VLENLLLGPPFAQRSARLTGHEGVGQSPAMALPCSSGAGWLLRRRDSAHVRAARAVLLITVVSLWGFSTQLLHRTLEDLGAAGGGIRRN